MFQLLIEKHGGDIKAKNGCGNTPLHDAFSHFDPNYGGDINILTYLINQKNFDADIKGKDGRTLLHEACRKIDTIPLDIFKVLIETHGGDVNVQNNENDTAIHNALAYFKPNKGGDITVLTYLLSQNNINANIKDEHGRTLLHTACDNINKFPLDILKVLIETHGGDVNVQDDDKYTPFHNALYYFDPNQGGDITVLRYLLTQKNINVNIRGRCSSTLLHYACDNINSLTVDVFKTLIETHGGDINAQDNNKDTPFHKALENFEPRNGGDITVLTYLLSRKGINANIKGGCGYTILHTACKRINKLPLDIFKLLIETLGCDVNVQDENKDTPIHLAFLHFDSGHDCSKTILTYLLSHKSINFNIKGQKGRNLLHWACICGTAPDSDDDYSSDDDLNDFDDSNNSVQGDTLFYPIIEMIVETCLGQIIDETTS
jgi:ankyrin repeat protein